MDVEPAWSRDGPHLYFVTARGGNFDIYRYKFADSSETPFIAGPRDQIQPAESPDGTGSPTSAQSLDGWAPAVSGSSRLPEGTGRSCTTRRPSIARSPAWTPDGQAILYSSDEPGSNDIAIVPAAGGNPVILSADPMNEFAPAVAPDGERFAFVSNRSGPTTLYVVPLGGGPRSSWTEIALSRGNRRKPTAEFADVCSVPDGQPTSARIYSRASDGRAYAPDGGFHRVIAATETHYFHTTARSSSMSPQARLRVEAMRGFEYPGNHESRGASGRNGRRGASAAAADRCAGARMVFRRYPRSRSASGSVWPVAPAVLRTARRRRPARDQRARSHGRHAPDGPLVRSDRQAPPLSTREHILQYGEEFRGSLGHVALIGIKRYVLPFTAGIGNTRTRSPSSMSLSRWRARAGRHRRLSASLQPAGAAAVRGAGMLIPVDVALGKGDFYDIGALVSDEIASAEFYYRLLNCGFRLAATSGTDNFSDVWRDPPPGADRAYVQIHGPLSLGSWIDGIKAQRTFGTTGPLVFLEVDGKGPGEEIALPAPTSRAEVKAEAVSIAPLEKLEVIVNGRVAQTVKPTDPSRSHLTASFRCLMAAGSRSACSVRLRGTSPTVTPLRRPAPSTSSAAADGGRPLRTHAFWRRWLMLSGRASTPSAPVAHARGAREVQGRHR